MTTVFRTQLGPDSSGLEQGRNAHGRWRWGYQRAEAPETGEPVPASVAVTHDSDRLAFAVTSGPAAAYLAEYITEYLWTRETLNEDWPVNLREWLADTDQWIGAPEGRTGFICGRLERNLPGGRIYLAWLGMHGIRLLDRSYDDITLDVAVSEDEGWTRDHGPEPEGLGLHAYRGSLFGLERLLVTSPGADPLRADLPDLAGPDIDTALADWAEEAEHDLAVFDLRLTPVLTEPAHVMVNYRWVAPELCMLFWQPSPNATAYRIEESETPDFESAGLVAELTDGRQTQYKISPPAASTRYYRVIPLNQGMWGTPSEPVRPTPLVLTAPVMHPVTWDPDGGYLLQWTPIDQATGYEVQTCPVVGFDPHESEVIYRGEIAELFLPPSTPPSRYYRVRAINVLYAPQTPSGWSQPRRAPARLETPHFTSVTQDQIAWDPVPGAQYYVVRVTGLGQDEEQGEEIRTRDTAIRAAEQPATYRVRAFRHPDDTRTASEWSDLVKLAPKETPTGPAQNALRAAVPFLLATALVALLVGAALGMGGIEAYQRARATATRTPLPEEAVQGTEKAVTAAVVNATQADILGTRVRSTEIAFMMGTGTATAWTQTPTPTATFTPSHTPNLTETIEIAFVGGLTATAAGWTATPTPTLTYTPSNTPDATETIEAAFAAGLTATAAGWTATPTPTATYTPSETPDAFATFETVFNAGLTSTAAAWTATPTPTVTATPSHTPDIGATLAAVLTATATHASPVPTLDAEATVAAYIETGCYIMRLPAEPVPVWENFAPDSPRVLESLPLLAQVLGGATRQGPQGRVDWLRVRVVQPDQTVTGWVRVPADMDSAEMTGGQNCP